MVQSNDSQPEKKGLFDRILDKFKSTTKEVAEKVENTVEDVKNSEFGDKVADTAHQVGEKAKDVIEDIKESQFAEKVTDAAGNVVDKAKELGGNVADFCAGKIKKAIGKIDFEGTLSKLREKQETSGKDLSGLINFVEKLQTIK